MIIFTDFASLFVPTLLTEATLQAAYARDDLEVSGICIGNPQPYYRLLSRYAQTVVSKHIKGFLDHRKRQTSRTPVPLNIVRLARRYDFSILTPPNRDINDPEFIMHLKKVIRPNIALSFYCHQKFSPELLHVFEQTANYHNGLLPQYRGLKATCWSVYQGEKETGFTFHHMNENFDEGHILLQGAVPVRSDSNVTDLEHEKALQAASDIPRLLDMLVNGEPGSPQTGPGSYFSWEDFRRIIRIADPGDHSSDELTRRLNAFVILLMNMSGTWYDVTKLERMSAHLQNPANLSFRTYDGTFMRPTRFLFLPLPLYKLLRWMRWPLLSTHETL